jgi:peptide/nickel transport system permease protein
MTGFLIRRAFQALLVAFLVTAFTLLLVDHFPGGGPVHALLGPHATPQQIAYYNQLWGFDQPFYRQYLTWAGQLLHGHLGYSIYLNQSVTGLIAQGLPKTIVLVALGTVASLLLGIPLGLYQAVKRYTTVDYLLTGIAFIGYATPTFFVALLLIQWFAIDIPLFPPFAPQGSTVAQILSDPSALVLPVAAYSFVLSALWSRYMRSAAMDNLVQDYVRTARAKGASERRVLWGHVFRNSLMSIITLLGLSLPALIAGDLFIEVVFNYPGMGLTFYNASLQEDYQVSLMFTLIATLAIIAANLLADVAYAVLDPRVRYT